MLPSAVISQTSKTETSVSLRGFLHVLTPGYRLAGGSSQSCRSFTGEEEGAQLIITHVFLQIL